MADHAQRVQPTVAARVGREGEGFRIGGLLALAVVTVAVIAGRSVVADAAASRVGADTTPAALASLARDQLDGALAANGLTFEIVQTSTIKARPDGPRVTIPDPADRTKDLGEADAYAVGTLIQRGIITPDGYWSELLHGPEPGAEADFDAAKAVSSRKGLVRDGVTYRDDGLGWHETAELPGIGLDPATIARLPELLGTAAGAKDVPLADAATAPAAELDPRFGAVATELHADEVAAAISGLESTDRAPVRALATTASAALLPGIIATDLAADTELLDPVELRFDDAGRLVAISASARNLRMTDYDLVVDTLITFRYPTGPPPLPRPEPRYVEPAPADDAEPVR